MGNSGSKPGPLVAPLLLRLVVGGTFIWAGLGKLVPSIDYRGQDAAILANLGTGIAPSHPSKVAPTAGSAPSMAPPATLPLPPVEAPKPGSPNGKPKSSKQTKPNTPVATASQTTPIYGAFVGDELPAAADATRKAGKPAGRQQPPAPPPPAPPSAAGTPTQTPAGNSDTLPPGGRYTAADFSEPTKARRAYTLCLTMVRAAHPQPVAGSPTPKAWWPQSLARSPWVVWLAFAVAVTELFAGVLLLVGFLTRVSSLMVVAIMFGAMWLTQIGPAWSVGQTTLGILPDKTWWDPALWSAFLWQVLIIASCIAMACLGAGAVSVDRALAIIGSGGPKAEQDPPPKA